MFQKVLQSTGFTGWRTSAIPVGIDWVRDLSRTLPRDSSPVFLDVGANRGHISARLAQSFPALQIFAFEPVTKTFRELGNEALVHKNIHPIRSAVGEREGNIDIYLYDCSEWNSTTNAVAGREMVRGKETVPITTIDSFASAQRLSFIHCLKTDTEGYDQAVLNGAVQLLQARRIFAILIELGTEPTDRQHTFYVSTVQWLANFGFRLYAFYDYFHNLNQASPTIFLNGLFVNWTPP